MKLDIVIKNGTVYDGSGRPPAQGDIGIAGDTIVLVGGKISEPADYTFDARGLAVAPGFINVLSHAWEGLIYDGRSLGDLCQGVTLEVIGEGVSVGPINDEIAREMIDEQGDIKYDISWRTLSEFMEFLTGRGISCNIASFVGATTIRMNELMNSDRRPAADELDRMRALVRSAMEDGALGVSSALIYTPACFADTEELTALAREAAPYGGIYISHIRSEGEALLESIEELISIARNAGLPAEIYHLKAAGRQNWGKIDRAIEMIEGARSEGLKITTDMYNYTLAQTGLDAAMPVWVQEGGLRAWIERLKDPSIRSRVRQDMMTQSASWENGYLHAGPENMILVGFKNENLKPLTGKTLAQVAEMRGRDAIDAAMDLVIEDFSRVRTVYGWMCEENIRKQIALPYMSFGSDGASMAPEGLFLKESTHPRAYGNFARLLGRYVRDEKLLPLEEAIRRLTSLPAENLSIKKRGSLKPGNFADVVVFDPAEIQDTATFENPHQIARGVHHVFVNGVHVLNEGTHTGAFPGRPVYGPGKRVSRDHA